MSYYLRRGFRAVWRMPCIVACILGGPALAHHSFALFDRSKYVRITGTVVDWQFTNPHSWLDLKQAGSGNAYAFETASVNVLAREGMNLGTFKPGDTVTVLEWPLRDGRLGGTVVFVTDARGKTYNTFPVPGGKP